MAGNTIPVLAADTPKKDENIYVNLNQDGSVSQIHVVNEFDLDSDTHIQDHGLYSSVKNLTSDEAIQIDNDTITVNGSKGKFLYQGEMENTELPWKIDIAYTLDGNTIRAEDLGGKSGKLEIKCSVKDNRNSEDSFFDNYLMQATVTLDTEKCSNIQAEGATQANVGKQRQLLYNIMAGQEKTFLISADVTDFEMSAISFQAVPMSFDINRDSLDFGSLTKKTDKVKDAAKEFDDGAKELDDGAADLLDGVEDLKKGAGDLDSGAGTLKTGTSGLLSGASQLSSGASSLSTGLGTLSQGANSLNQGISQVDSGVDTVKNGAKDLSSGAKEAAEGSKTLKKGTQTLSSSLSELMKGAGQLQTGLDALVQKSPQLTNGSAQILDALKQIQASLTSINVGSEQMQTLLTSSGQILTSIQALESGAGQVSGGLASIQGNYEKINQLEQQNAATATKIQEEKPELAGLLQQNNAVLEFLKKGIDQAAAGAGSVYHGLDALEQNYQQFDQQIQSLPVILQNMVSEQTATLKQAIDQLVESYTVLNQGINEYTGATAEIQAGYDTLYDALVQVEDGVDSLVEGADALAKGNASLFAGSSDLYEGTVSLKSGTSQLVSGGQSVASGAGSAASGANQLVSGASSLVSGASQLNSGAADLKTGTSDLYDGAGKLYDGTSDLKDGTKELLDGTGEFVDETKNIDGEMDDEIDKAIDEMSGGDYEPVSFVSDQNTNIGLVQFVMQTPEISKPEEEVLQVQEKQKTFLDKLKDLF